MSSQMNTVQRTFYQYWTVTWGTGNEGENKVHHHFTSKVEADLAAPAPIGSYNVAGSVKEILVPIEENISTSCKYWDSAREWAKDKLNYNQYTELFG